MKVEISLTFNYGGWTLYFTRKMDLPFAPFFGMEITDNDERTVELKNDDYCTTVIQWNTDENQFEIYVRNWWNRPVSDDTIDYTISQFDSGGWERKDSTNISELKELMARDHARHSNKS